MMNAVMVDRATGAGKYADVIDVAEALGAGDYGSAANALAVMVRQSELFRATLPQVRAQSNKRRNGRKTTQTAENAA